MLALVVWNVSNFFCTNCSQNMFVHLLQDFMKEPIISQDVFLAIDKNKDGWIRILANFRFLLIRSGFIWRYVSRGELKLAQRNLSLTQVNAIIDELDVNGDGKLTFDEVKQVALKVKDQAKVSKSKKSIRWWWWWFGAFPAPLPWWESIVIPERR